MILIAGGLLVATAANADENDSPLAVAFEPATATVAPRETSRPIDLPDLTFAFRAQAFCPDEQVAESVTISIADTRITVRPDDNGIIEKSIVVPRKQLAPVVANDFCLLDEAEQPELALQVDDAMSAQLSLRCAGENSESIRYQTTSLNVALQCEVPETPR